MSVSFFAYVCAGLTMNFSFMVRCMYAYPQNSMHTTTGQNWKKTAGIIFTLVLVLLGTAIGLWWLLVTESK